MTASSSTAWTTKMPASSRSPFPIRMGNRQWRSSTGHSFPGLVRKKRRLSLHPAGLAPRIRNLPQWRAHLLQRLRQQIDASHDPQLIVLLRELQALPAPSPDAAAEIATPATIAVPMQLEVDGVVLSMLSTTTVFGSPVDITLAELALEAFVPADAETAEQLRRMAQSRR